MISGLLVFMQIHIFMNIAKEMEVQRRFLVSPPFPSISIRQNLTNLLREDFR